MLQHYISLFVIAVPLLATASAGSLERSPTERFFLANCGSAAGNWKSSQVGYYATNAGEIEGQSPTAQFDWGHVVTWEGSTLEASLSNGDIFTSQVHANASSQPVWASVGTGISSTEVWQCSKRWGGDQGFPEGWDDGSNEICYVLYECSTS